MWDWIWQPNEAQAILAAGMALGGAIGALVVGAYAWDFGYLAGERDERRRWQAEQRAMYDGIGKVL